MLLTQADLRPLAELSSELDGAFAAIQEAFLEHQRGEAKLYAGTELPLTGEQRSLRVLPSASPANGAGVRFNPLVGRLDNPDSFVNLLFDGANGQLLALIAGDDLNVVRTATPAGLAARYLAPEGARTMGMLGSGRQARGQVIAVKHALPRLERVRVFSPTPAHRAAFAEEMTRRLGVPVEAVDEPRRAVEGADVVGVTSNAREPVLQAEWVRAGALILSMSAGQLPPEVVLRSRVIVSSMPEVVEVRREPYRSLIADGRWGADRVAATMAEVIEGGTPGRTSQSETVLYEMPGMSIWDTAIMRWAYRWALANELGSTFHLSSP
ncbi:MAG TPA: ornithine cyclodeaminase family protein [Chloroflexota bacterium]|nr:ornithine cyclodeaminase family protein [Chloroflexota bacterium]